MARSPANKHAVNLQQRTMSLATIISDDHICAPRPQPDANRDGHRLKNLNAAS